jgi:hypothetical protein
MHGSQHLYICVYICVYIYIYIYICVSVCLAYIFRICPQAGCADLQFASRTSCRRCGAPKPGTQDQSPTHAAPVACPPVHTSTRPGDWWEQFTRLHQNVPCYGSLCHFFMSGHAPKWVVVLFNLPNDNLAETVVLQNLSLKTKSMLQYHHLLRILRVSVFPAKPSQGTGRVSSLHHRRVFKSDAPPPSHTHTLTHL